MIRLKKHLTLFVLAFGTSTQAGYLCPNNRGHKVALTFDDGPHPNRTEIVIQALEERNTPATFFILGSQSSKYPELTSRIAARFRIANHGWKHINYTRSTVEEQRGDIERSTLQLEAFLDEPWKFRLPYGAGLRGDPQRLVESYGYRHIYWSIDPRDWDANLSAEESFQIILSEANKTPSTMYPNGHVLLLHDVQAKTAAHLGSWIDRLEDQGHCFVSLREVL
ncbi:polysaccharide deacetylase family protein [bacterium]|nr:polysaccharide deacetylase family protein [bacterium]